jgi:hypothetical protein
VRLPLSVPEVLAVLRQSADRVTLTGKDGVVVMVTASLEEKQRPITRSMSSTRPDGRNQARRRGPHATSEKTCDRVRSSRRRSVSDMNAVPLAGARQTREGAGRTSGVGTLT